MQIPPPTLETARLRLRPVRDADASALFAMHSAIPVMRYWDSPPWRTPARARRFLDASRAMEQEGTGTRLVVERHDATFLGWCSVTGWNRDYRSASLGYCFDESAWGHGYATEAAGAVVRWAFETLELHRIQAETDTRNAASARVLAKVGFTPEGRLRENCIVDGEVSDSWVFGLLRREWRPADPPATATTS